MINDISLAKFLSRYASLKGRNLKKLTHDDVKILFPQLQRCSFDDLKEHPEYVYNNIVMFVNDGKHTIPYFVKKIKKDEEDLETIEEVEGPEIIEDIEELEIIREEVAPIQVDDSDYDFSKLTNYELRCLLPRRTNSLRNQSGAKRELNRRGIVLHKDYDRNEVKKLLLREKKNERN